MSRKSTIKTLFASILGTALEFYDFMLYLTFMEAIGKEFFPSHGDLDSIMFGALGFLAAFIARPFGATIFGYIGDKYGRRKALILSVSLMGIPTLIIGILPGYAAWGIAAPLILLLCRLVQGICTGGEYNGSAIFALEHLGKNHPGMFGGLITASSVSGALLANGVGIFLKQPGMPEHAWRYAFALGAVISLVGLYIRLHTSESPEFERLAKNKKLDKSPLLDAIKNHWPSSLTTIITGTLNGVLSYTMYKFLSIYLVRWGGYTETTALKFSSFGIIVYVIFAPIMGYMLDKMGGQTYMKRASIMVGLLSFPIFYFFQEPSYTTTYIAAALLALSVASIAGPEHAFIQKLFPVKDRYSGVAFNYCVGMGIGSAMPFVLTYLIEKTHFMYMPSVAILVVSIITYIAVRHIGRTYLAIQEENEKDMAETS